MKISLILMVLAFAANACNRNSAGGVGTTDNNQTQMSDTNIPDTSKKMVKSAEEWKKQLSPFQYEVLREKGTERAFTGEYWNTMDKGLYTCAACDQKLFYSDQKFQSSCGWPSFFEGIDGAVVEHADNSHGMRRTEIVCSRCDGHLGHVFDDGPPPTGRRYCINSASLKFHPGVTLDKDPSTGEGK